MANTLTFISPFIAVLYGRADPNPIHNELHCWLLDVHNAKLLKSPSLIWTRIPLPNDYRVTRQLESYILLLSIWGVPRLVGRYCS